MQDSAMGVKMKRNLKMAAWMVSAILTLGTFALAQDYDHDRDRDDFHHAGYERRNVGFDTGYQDGVYSARSDIYHNKRFNPNPRGKFDDLDHGYRREYGDKAYYKSQYLSGYRAGYEAVFGRRY